MSKLEPNSFLDKVSSVHKVKERKDLQDPHTLVLLIINEIQISERSQGFAVRLEGLFAVLRSSL